MKMRGQIERIERKKVINKEKTNLNPVFYALCIIVGVFIWACCAFMFKKLGSVLTSIFGDAIKEMSDEDENNKNEGENKHE